MTQRPPPRPRSHPVAQALLAGLMQGVGEREGDQQLRNAGEWLAKAAIAEDEARRRRLDVFRRFLDPPRPDFVLKALPRPAPPQDVPRPLWLRWLLRLVRRSRAS